MSAAIKLKKLISGETTLGMAIKERESKLVDYLREHGAVQ